MASSPKQNDDPTRADAVRNREKLLKTARAAVAKGDTALQLNEIARKAGVGVGTAYRHFPTPTALLEALANERLQQLLLEAESSETEDDPWMSIERVLRLALDMELTQPGVATVLAAAEDARAETSELKRKFGAAVQRILDRAQVAHRVRPDVSADDIRRLVCGVEYAVSLGDRTDRAATERLLGVLLDGLRVSPKQ
jgi:AcrR family transcriptional regulator